MKCDAAHIVRGGRNAGKTREVYRDMELIHALCTHGWHEKQDAEWCPACGFRRDRKITLCNATLGALMLGPLRVRNMFSGEERVVRWMETNPEGCLIKGLEDDPEKERRMDSVELQAWEYLGHETST